MKIEDLKNKKIAILGFGEEGLSTARFLAKNNIPFSILEKKKFQELETEAQEFIKTDSINYIVGQEHLDRLLDFEVIFRTPGFPLWHPKIIQVKKKGAIITSHIKLFFDLCPGLIIGVTGTKGKGTTATLIYEMLKASGFNVHLGGNIGQPPLDFLEKLTEKSRVVLELSSFQLEDLNKSPHVAVVLMVTQEHLDSGALESPNFHRNLEEYLVAKENIVKHQGKGDFVIVNYDYPSSRNLLINAKSQRYFFSTQNKLEEGGYIEGENLVVRLHGSRVGLCERSEVFIKGEHNLQNILAAATTSLLVGAERSKVIEVIKTFKGLEHRLEFVRELDKVKYYNDSFSTTPETAIAAIKSFTQTQILILGGSEKGSDYTELGQVVARSQNIKAVILIGITADKIRGSISRGFKGLDPRIGSNPIEIFEGPRSMNDIVSKSQELAESGDVVLLSPACASFDMFKNYKDRGEQFKNAVMNL